MKKKDMIKEVTRQVPDATPEEVARITGSSKSYVQAEIAGPPTGLRALKKKSINRQK